MPTSSFTAANEALHQATERRDLPAFEAALDAGADVNAVSVIGVTPLHDVAVFWGHLPAMERLISAGAAVDALTPEGETPLLAAISHAHYSAQNPAQLRAVIEWFVHHGASLTVADNAGRTPLGHAFQSAQLPLVELLVDLGAVLPADSLARAIVIGAASCNVELVRFVLAHSPHLDLQVRDSFGGTLAHRAAESARTLFLLEWLAAHGADLLATDTAGHTVFATAAGALGGNVPAMEFLQRRGALTFAVARDGSTPMHAAATDPRPAVLRWLLGVGGDLEARDALGRRALDVAIDTHRFAFRTEEQKAELVAVLGGSLADIERGRFYEHPLIAAVSARDLGAVKRLLRQGANANTRNESGNTPLRAALDRVSSLPFTADEHAFGRKLLPLLIEFGADSTLRMGDGFNGTYADHARELGVADELSDAIRRYAPKVR